MQTDHIAEPLRPLAVAVKSLNRDPGNARRHPQRNLDAVKSSLTIFGQRAPLVVQREGNIVRAGNARLAAAIELGWKSIAVIYVDDDDARAEQFAIADNRTSELAEWDSPVLLDLLQGFDEGERLALGFDENDVDRILEMMDGNEVDPNDIANTRSRLEGEFVTTKDVTCPKCDHGFEVEV